MRMIYTDRKVAERVEIRNDPWRNLQLFSFPVSTLSTGEACHTWESIIVSTRNQVKSKSMWDTLHT